MHARNRHQKGGFKPSRAVKKEKKKDAPERRKKKSKKKHGERRAQVRTSGIRKPQLKKTPSEEKLTKTATNVRRKV